MKELVDRHQEEVVELRNENEKLEAVSPSAFPRRKLSQTSHTVHAAVPRMTGGRSGDEDCGARFEELRRQLR